MKTLLSLLIAAAVFTPLASSAASVPFNAGDLIKGSLAAVYYFGPDGYRYVFPNEKTYFTWYTDFSGVKTISDGQLSTIPLGRSNVTYRPGRKLVKITTDPKVYVVDQGGILRHVTSEQLAQTLYPIWWRNQVDDIPDMLFTNYRIGTPIQTASDYKPADVMTLTTAIAQDKQFDEKALTVTIGSVNNAFVPATTTVKKGTRITWTNRDVAPHTVTGNGWQSGTLAPGQTYWHVFNNAGSFDYYCAIHPVMQGTINVL